MQDCTSSGAKVGSGVWVGTGCKVSVQRCKLTGNESYGVEANHEDAVANVADCTLADNGKGESDAWDGGKVSLDTKPSS